MRQCSRCGKKGIFLRLNSASLCAKCVEDDLAEKKRKQEQEIQNAVEYIQDFSKHIEAALAHTTILRHWGAEKVHAQYLQCQYVLEHIDDWKSIPHFNEAFNRTLVQGKHFKESPLFPSTRISDYSDPDFEGLFQELKKKVSRVSSDCIIAEHRAYDYSKIFKVVGVTFKNGRKSRQTLLRKLRFGDAPFDGYVKLELEKRDFEGEDAVGVFANGEQLGNISRDDLPWLLEHWDEYYSVDEYDVCGGNGYNFGLDIRVGFRKTK